MYGEDIYYEQNFIYQKILASLLGYVCETGLAPRARQSSLSCILGLCRKYLRIINSDFFLQYQPGEE